MATRSRRTFRHATAYPEIFIDNAFLRYSIPCKASFDAELSFIRPQIIQHLCVQQVARDRCFASPQAIQQAGAGVGLVALNVTAERRLDDDKWFACRLLGNWH